MIKERRHIHGDQLEGDPSRYYCSACDVFFTEDHFFGQGEKCCNHWDRYDSAIKMLGKSEKKRREFGRHIDSPNIFKS